MKTGIEKLVESISLDPRHDALIAKRDELRKQLAGHKKELAVHTNRVARLERSVANLNREAGRVVEIRQTDSNPTYNRLNEVVTELQNAKTSLDNFQHDCVAPREKTLEIVEKDIANICGKEDRDISEAIERYLTVLDVKEVKAWLMDMRSTPNRLTAKIAQAIHKKIYPND